MPLDLALSPAQLRAEPAEPDLIERAKRDPAAFATLYRRHYGLVAGFILRRVGNRHVAEDLTADVFLLALRHLPRYHQHGTPLQIWLYRIAINTVSRWARREGYQRRLRDLLHGPAGESIRLVRGLPEQSVTSGSELDSEADRARRLLLRLPPKYHAVLSLHYLEGLNLEEIALTVGCRIGTVKSRLSRGRDALRGLLERSA